MPDSWPDGDDPGADDADSPRLTPPVHPDDRLWRHPSELAWGTGPRPAWPEPLTHAASTEGGGGREKARPRLWMLSLTSGLAGAAVAVGVIAIIAGIGSGGTQRVVERVGVRDQLADPLAVLPAAGLSDIAQDVIPSVVRLEVDTAGGTAVGSGIVLLDDGHILTNAHVVDGAEQVTIVLADGTSVSGEVVGSDPVSDIAVVAPTGDTVAAVTWVPAVRGPAEELVVGDPAVAIGSPLAMTGAPSVTLGVVSALGRRVTTSDGGVLHDMIQTDAPIADGSSGGALCDRAGRVVGITTSQAADEAAGMGFATPMETAWRMAEALISDGEVHHVWVGIEGSDLDANRSSLLGMTSATSGVFVDRVTPDSPAAAAGLADGDVLVAIDGAPLATMSDLVRALEAYEPGDDASFEVLRGDRTMEVTVTLAERPG